MGGKNQILENFLHGDMTNPDAFFNYLGLYLSPGRLWGWRPINKKEPWLLALRNEPQPRPQRVSKMNAKMQQWGLISSWQRQRVPTPAVTRRTVGQIRQKCKEITNLM